MVSVAPKDYKALEEALMEATGHKLRGIVVTDTEQIDKEGHTIRRGIYVHGRTMSDRQIGAEYTDVLIGKMSYEKAIKFISKQLMACAHIKYTPLLWDIQKKIRKGI